MPWDDPVGWKPKPYLTGAVGHHQQAQFEEREPSQKRLEWIETDREWREHQLGQKTPPVR